MCVLTSVNLPFLYPVYSEHSINIHSDFNYGLVLHTLTHILNFFYIESVLNCHLKTFHLLSTLLLYFFYSVLKSFSSHENDLSLLFFLHSTLKSFWTLFAVRFQSELWLHFILFQNIIVWLSEMSLVLLSTLWNLYH